MRTTFSLFGIESLFSALGAPSHTAGTRAEYLIGRFLSTLALVTAMAIAAHQSSLSGRRLGIALYSPLMGLFLLIQCEGMFFLGISWTDTLWASVQVAIYFALVAGLLVIALRRGHSQESMPVSFSYTLAWWQWSGRFILTAFAYLTLFMIAGILILPYVQHAYADQPMMQGGQGVFWMFPLELFRGAGHAAFILPLLLSLRGGRLQAGLIAGLLFVVLDGLAPLLVPNEYMSASVRAYHMIEIGWSNFVFGLIVGALFVPEVLQRASARRSERATGIAGAAEPDDASSSEARQPGLNAV